MDGKYNVSIEFANWLSLNYNIENGVGHWYDHFQISVLYTTEELWEIFNIEILRKRKIEKIKSKL